VWRRGEEAGDKTLERGRANRFKRDTAHDFSHRDQPVYISGHEAGHPTISGYSSRNTGDPGGRLGVAGNGSQTSDDPASPPPDRKIAITLEATSK
jgi:hypothetical protein